MFKKLLFKSVVGATAVGSALTLSVATTPAVTASAPEFQTVGYPASGATTTALHLSRSVATYGQTTTATANVSRKNGQVHFVLSGPGGVIRTWTVTVGNGAASVTLPRLNARVTYTVTARYWAPKGFQNSHDSAYYTVKPAGTGTSVSAPNVWVLRAAHASAVVSSKSPYTVPGQVRFTVFRNGHQVKSVTSSLSREHASASFGKLPVGRYTVRAVYLGSQNFSRSAGSDAFRVTK